MKHITKRYQTLILLAGLIGLFISCNNDFVDINSDLVNEEVATNFNLDSIEYDVIAYTMPLGPVQSNNLTTNHIGLYEDIQFGQSNYNFLTQIGPEFYDPDFGENPVIDSVTFYIPYYSTNIGTGESGLTEYELDSVYGSEPIKITLFENDYFLRDFDPDGELGEPQNYYSNKSASEFEPISDELLEGTVLLDTASFAVSSESVYLLGNEEDTTQTLLPGMYFKLDNDYWKQKIIDQEGSSELANESAFRNYFRGIYFKTEGINNKGTLIGLNLGNNLSNITIYYKNDSSFEEGNLDPDGNPAQFNYRFNFQGNQVNFIDNDFEGSIPGGDQVNGDENLYLKGGEGSLAGIELFSEDNALEDFKNTYADYDPETGEFIAYKRLINEANLVLFVNQNEVNGNEPERLYLYDLNNGTRLIDYSFDAFVSNVPRLSVASHLGILQREDGEPDGEGIRYTMKLTRHLLNIIESDSTNVRLGLAVASNVNLEAETNQGDVQATEGSAEMVPLSSITSPRGTVLFGNNTSYEEKKLRLKIFYTCLKDNEDCEIDN